ncbi:cell wall protein [Rathayibacter sp. YIM 133350]
MLAGALVLVPAAAHAELYVPGPPPADPSLAGSVVASECDGDVPWITYDVVLVDPDDKATSHTAYLTLAAGGRSIKLLLGEIVNGHLAGRIIWPGASVAADGTAIGWPGWKQVGGRWVQTDENYGWTRSLTSALITVNPEVTVPIGYPTATPACASAPPKTMVAASSTTTIPSAGGLSSTGVNPFLLPAGAVAVVGIGIGVGIALRRRPRSR